MSNLEKIKQSAIRLEKQESILGVEIYAPSKKYPYWAMLDSTGEISVRAKTFSNAIDLFYRLINTK